MAVRIERQLEPSRLMSWLIPVLAIVLALISGGIVFLASGYQPLSVYGAMLSGAFGSRNGLAETAVKAIPLLLAALGISVAFRMLVWNIGAEGQLHMGAVAASGTALFLLPDAPAALLIPATLAAGFAGGALWAAIPALLRAYLKTNEIITSLMLNYVAILFTEYLVNGPWRNPAGFG